MQSFGAVFLIVGFMLTMGAVGGMESVPVYEPNPLYGYQVLLAFIGVAIMYGGVSMLGDEDE